MRDLPKLDTPHSVLKFFWPDVLMYDRQREMYTSVRYNDETFVVAANMMGKDFVSGFIALGSFMFPNAFLRPKGYPLPSRECRVVTTSVRDDHLRVLWGEIGRFIDTSSFPGARDVKGVLKVEKGGPLVVNHRDIRWHSSTTNEVCKISYLRGMVSALGEGMAGHHAAHTLAVIDEASGVRDIVYDQCRTWAKKLLAFGNANPATNFFRKACKEGDIRK